MIFAFYCLYAMSRGLSREDIVTIICAGIGAGLLEVFIIIQEKNRKKEKQRGEYETRNKGKIEVKVTIEDGYWTCPSCNFKNHDFQDLCSECGQGVEK